jgi:Tol biopolymer transport system component
VSAVRAGIAAVALLIGGGAADTLDAPAAVFFTVPQANGRGRPSDPPEVSVSANGRYVAFTSFARLSVKDTNECADVYVLDRATGRVTLESLTPDGRASSCASERPRLAGDGRLLIYETTGDAAGAGLPPRSVVVLRDRLTGATRLLERPEVAANGGSRDAAISADGRVVVLTSAATNLADGPDANESADDVYSVDVASMTIRRVSVDAAGRQPAAGASFAPALSADGRYIVFSSTAPLDGAVVPPAAATGRPQVNVYLRDMTLGLTTRVSVRAGSAAPNGSSYEPAISGDGRYVAFVSDATNLVGHDENRAADVFLRDLRTGTTELVSRSESGGSANGPSVHPAISGDGGIVAFQSDASDLFCGRPCAQAVRDINLVSDVFVFDRASRVIRRVSTGRPPWMEPSIGPAIDATGTVIAFSSRHPIDARDDRDDYDLFIRVPGHSRR